ncbi:hypothetical protein AQJ11_37740 [Streptomyces corchorusii]|uniref:Uncharacterized protein n=2 Tax=Streptomyces TaxID=1883 RepID=A0A124HJU7_STRCK|nr:hypothetical protein AQJ11_37740 [Streptomyces corchorusii]
MAVLYQSGGFSPDHLADLYGETVATVHSELRNEGVEVTHPGPSPDPIAVTMEALYDLRLSIDRVGWLCGCSYRKARKILLGAGVELREGRTPLKQEVDVPRLVKLYESRLSVPAIAKECGISYGTAYNRLRDAGVLRGLRKEVDVPRLVKLYESRLSIPAIAKECGISYSTAYNRLRNAGALRGLRAKPLRPSNPLPASTVVDLHLQGYMKEDITRLTGRSNSFVHHHLALAGLPVRVRPDALSVDTETLLAVYRIVASSAVTAEILHLSEGAVFNRLYEAGQEILAAPDPEAPPLHIPSPSAWQRRHQDILARAAKGQGGYSIATALKIPPAEVFEVLRLYQSRDHTSAEILYRHGQGESPGVIAIRMGLRLDRIKSVLAKYSARHSPRRT